MCRVLNICLIFGDIVHLRTWDVGQVGLGQVDKGKDECRKRRIHERRESRLEGYRKGGFMTEEIQNGRDATVDRRDKGQLGGRTDGIQDWRESELEGFNTGGIQDGRDSGKGEFRKGGS